VSEPKDITLWRMAQRANEEPDFKESLDLAMSVRHLPLHDPGECRLCDAHREKEES